jgi:hypothetical protein
MITDSDRRPAARSCPRPGGGTDASADCRERAGWVDASSSCQSARVEVWLRRFPLPPQVIMVAVRWYLRYGLSSRDVEELLAERDITVDHVSVDRWVQRLLRC